MRIVTVDRRSLASAGPLAFGEDGPLPVDVIALLDRHDVPDGFPFVVDDDGGMRGCQFLNGYLLAALRQDAYALGNLKNNHLYHLVRLLRFVRRRRAELPRAAALEMVIQSAVGAAIMLRDSGDHPVMLREAVTSPAGTTISAIRELERHGVRAAVIEAIEAARDRGRELGAG